ncbi:MAG: glycosyltransferase [Ruminiclostridium sp.]|nr:glycosyltransferase [Bacillota bacterium]MBR1832843.1 glycosyltransferase [Ruminiclostridium sp.]
MKLSVIIVSYNEAEYLKRAIDSCLQQNFDSYEIIIGDDGSDDGSIDIIKRYGDKVKFFVMERNETEIVPSIRVSRIIKKGISISKGEYICCLSGDDFFTDKNRFRDHCSFLDSHLNYSSVFSRYSKYYGDTKKLVRMDRSSDNRSFFWSGQYTHISCFTFRRYIYDSGKLLDRLCDDTGLIYSIAVSGKWHCINRFTFAYFQRSGSIMSNADELELALIELILMQDIFKKKRMLLSSMSRFSSPIGICIKNSDKLSENKYHKYLRLLKKNKGIVYHIVSYSDLCLAEKIMVKIFYNVTRTVRKFFSISFNIFSAVCEK